MVNAISFPLERIWFERSPSVMSISTGKSVRSETPNESTILSGYMPDAVDFLRRCDNAREAKKIIDFLEKRGEISDKYATKLRHQLREKGIRSFGTKKTDGYYLR